MIINPYSSFGGGGGGAFTPASLFASSERGAWYDFNDLSTLSQDTAGTIPVTAAGQPIGLARDKSGNGQHISQVTSGNRPVLQSDGTSFYIQCTAASNQYLRRDVNIIECRTQSMVGVVAYKVDDGSTATIYSRQTPSGGYPGRYQFTSVITALGGLYTGFYECPTGAPEVWVTTSSLNKAVGSQTMDRVAGSMLVRRIEGLSSPITASVAIPLDSSDLTCSVPFIVGGYNSGASQPMSGRIYGVVIRFTSTIDTTARANTESWMSSQYGT